MVQSTLLSKEKVLFLTLILFISSLSQVFQQYNLEDENLDNAISTKFSSSNNNPFNWTFVYSTSCYGFAIYETKDGYKCKNIQMTNNSIESFSTIPNTEPSLPSNISNQGILRWFTNNTTILISHDDIFKLSSCVGFVWI